MLHWFARLVAASTVVLVLGCSFVTSTGSGFSALDWPTTYGWDMFTFTPPKWVGGIFCENGHPLITSWRGRFALDVPSVASAASAAARIGAGARATTGARA